MQLSRAPPTFPPAGHALLQSPWSHPICIPQAFSIGLVRQHVSARCND